MKLVANILTALVAIIHVGILVLEMFYWDPIGGRIFLMTPEATTASVSMAMNQGLYNGFLAAGLFWGVLQNKLDLKIFFLTCVIIAAIFGALTIKTSIILSQGSPAIIALIFVLLSARKSN